MLLNWAAQTEQKTTEFKLRARFAFLSGLLKKCPSTGFIAVSIIPSQHSASQEKHCTGTSLPCGESRLTPTGSCCFIRLDALAQAVGIGEQDHALAITALRCTDRRVSPIRSSFSRLGENVC